MTTWLTDESGAGLHSVASQLYAALMRGEKRTVSGGSEASASNICARLDTMQRVLGDEPQAQRGFRATRRTGNSHEYWRATQEDTYIDNC